MRIIVRVIDPAARSGTIYSIYREMRQGLISGSGSYLLRIGVIPTNAAAVEQLFPDRRSRISCNQAAPFPTNLDQSTRTIVRPGKFVQGKKYLTLLQYIAIL